MANAAANRPISSHPAFRWAVGLWFAALLGAGLFVMPDSVHLAIRQALGIDGLLPGATVGKAALAGAAAALGFLLGLVLAGRVAALNAARDLGDDDSEYDELAWQDEMPEAVEPVVDEPRRPFSPREYFGKEGKDDFHDPDAADFEEIVEDVGESPLEPPVIDIVADEIEVEAVTARETSATVEADVPSVPFEHEATEALGDLPLAELTRRLQRALDASRARAEAPPTADDGELDPVIAFLRREADRTATKPGETGADDAQAALRSALHRLSQVSNPR